MRTAHNAKFNFPHLFKHEIRLGKLDWQFGDMGSLAALVTLCCLVKSGYEPVFEFGTFRGRTTYNLALNAKHTVITVDWNGASDAGMDRSRFAECIQDCPVDVLQINADSRTHDFSDLYGYMGLVFVDGGHDYETCKSDTENAFKLIRPGGLVIWDDYNVDWPGVMRAIDEVDAQGHDLIFFKEESLVVYGLK